jgi:hypothetical protein
MAVIDPDGTISSSDSGRSHRTFRRIGCAIDSVAPSCLAELSNRIGRLQRQWCHQARDLLWSSVGGISADCKLLRDFASKAGFRYTACQNVSRIQVQRILDTHLRSAR